MKNMISEQYQQAVFDTDRQLALQIVQNAIDNGVLPEEIVFDIVVPSIEDSISSVSERRYTNLAQHFMASQIAAEVTEMMVPLFRQAPEIVGKMVIGTSSGDFHGLGKRIVKGCLKAQMIEVTDLGLSVPAERFVDQAVELGAAVIGISSMMAHTARSENGSIGVRRLLKERGLEQQIRIIVGGTPYNHDERLYRTVCADAWARNGIEAGAVIVRLLGEIRP